MNITLVRSHQANWPTTNILYTKEYYYTVYFEVCYNIIRKYSSAYEWWLVMMTSISKLVVVWILTTMVIAYYADKTFSLLSGSIVFFILSTAKVFSSIQEVSDKLYGRQAFV